VCLKRQRLAPDAPNAWSVGISNFPRLNNPRSFDLSAFLALGAVSAGAPSVRWFAKDVCFFSNPFLGDPLR